MKTRYKISIFIAVILIIASIVGFLSFEESTNTKNTGRFNYQDSEQVISETYLDKNVNQWQKESNESIMEFYEREGGDEFFVKLGALVVKNAMIIELDKQNIEVTNLDFKVHSGMMLTSLPPHVSFEGYVNSTDGDTYRLSGMTMRAQVNSPVHIVPLEFFDTNKKLSIESVTSSNNTIILHDKNNNDPRAIPRNLIVTGDKDIEIHFQNDNSVPVRIQSRGGDWQNPNWYGPTILPFTTGTMTFDNPGVHEWHARTLPLPGSQASDSMGGGMIGVIPSNVNKLTFDEKQEIANGILQNSEIPSAMMWGNEEGIMMGFNGAIYDILPDADEYYTQRAHQLIPFDVTIIIEKWN